EADTVSKYYDTLIAKVIVWGRDREEARLRMLRALRETDLQGPATTIPADIAILEHPDSTNVEHSTSWLEQMLALSVLASPPPQPAPDGSDGEPPRLQRDVDLEVDGR